MAKDAANRQTSGQVVGENLRRFRVQHRLTQEQVVGMALNEGLAWTVDVVGQLEAGRRADVTVSELAAMLQAFGPTFRLREVWDWYAGDGEMRLNDTTTLNRAAMRVLLGSRRSADRKAASTMATDHVGTDRKTIRASLTEWMVLQPATQAELHVAQVLKVPTSTVKRLAMDLWGRRLDEERERRLGTRDKLPPNEARAHRGRVTRDLRDELAGALPKESPA